MRFRNGRSSAPDNDAVEAAARAWLLEINRINGEAREAAAMLTREREAARAVGASLERLSLDADAARIAADEAAADLNAGLAIVRQAEAAAAQAKATVNQAAVNVEHTIIRSPVDGIVIERSVDVGQTLAASVQSPVLFRIAAARVEDGQTKMGLSNLRHGGHRIR